MLNAIKMITCLPWMVLGAVVGIVFRSITEGFDWGKDDFFT